MKLTHEELREAEETIRDCLPSTVYHMGAAGKLALAYLAEHPADDAEPVTEEWFRSVGLTNPTLYSEPDKGYYGDRVAALMFADKDSVPSRFGVMFSDGPDGWNWWACMVNADGFDGSQDYLCPAPTRGHVRRLCAALGITLTEK